MPGLGSGGWGGWLWKLCGVIMFCVLSCLNLLECDEHWLRVLLFWFNLYAYTVLLLRCVSDDNVVIVQFVVVVVSFLIHM